MKLKKLDHTIKKKKKKKEEKKLIEAPVSNQTQNEEQEDIDAAIEAKIRERNPLLNKTKAELRYIKMQEKMKAKRVMDKASKTHKMRVEEFNRHLDNLTEHFDIPKVSWTK
ncbi:unnamed protein product [Allacma fusca]|uniref:Protein FAM32A n=1 Tax=Allacma fusca TaxID=39272 RepID=A0A8J2LMC4_9HEXA|nr:unnamed protein product [Allacma fusca]